MTDLCRVASIRLLRLSLPLIVPYKLSYRTFTEFEPFVVIITDDTGAQGFGEGHISPGSSSETREGGWQFIRVLMPQLLEQPVASAKAAINAISTDSPVAATAVMAALEMLEGNQFLNDPNPLSLPLLSPVNGTTPDALEPELENRLAQGFATFKVKVGSDVQGDIRRFSTIQSIIDGRATLRIDANRAYSQADATQFATSINPDGVELFEQPCDSDDWDANAGVASRSRVPLMLDEPICSLHDIQRAEAMDGVGFCKVKLKRFGGIKNLHTAIRLIRECGMSPVLGDGLGAEVACWMEACVARDTIDNAGEFNGYLKPSGRLLREPVGFESGHLVIPANYRPAFDDTLLQAATTDSVTVA